MKKWWLILVLSISAAAQTTPNIGLNIPAFGTQNWNVLLNSNFSKLDLLLSGNQTLPGLNVSGNLTVSGTISGNNNVISTNGTTGLAIVALGGGVGNGALSLSNAAHGGTSISDNNGNALILGASSPLAANINLSNVNKTGAFINTSGSTAYLYGSPLQIGVNPTPGGISNVSVGFNITSNVTVLGELITQAATTSSAGLNLPPGVQPTSPVNGDLWITSAGVFAQINGSTVGPFSTSSGTGLSGMTAGQVPIAATSSTVISSKALAGGGASIPTGPNSSTSNDLACFTGTAGQLADCSIAKGNVVLAVSPTVGIAHFAGGTQTVTSTAVDLSGADVTGNLGVSHLNSGSGASTTTFLRGDMTWQTPAGSTGVWSSLLNPTGNLFLSMGSNISTFNTTTAVSQFFAWKNTTAAVLATSQSSPINSLCGREWTGADTEGCLTLQFIPNNGLNAGGNLTIGYSGSGSGTYTTTAPGPIAAGTSGSSGALSLPGSSSGTATLTVQAAAGTPTITLGTSSGTPAVTASSPLTITTSTGNITCTTCVVASSPGLGLAHFAGSTQTVTSSLVVIADLSATGTPSSSTFLRGDGTWSTPGGSGTVTVVGSGNLTSTAMVTGGGTTTLQTVCATCTLDSSGNQILAAGGSLKSADTGTPGFTFATSKVTINQPLTHGVASNQEVFGLTTNLTTVTYPASSGAVTLTMPNTSTLILGGNSDTTTTDVCHASATAAICNFTGIVVGDLPTITIAKGGTNATSAATGQVPNTTSTTASSWTSTVTLGASGTLGSLAMGNATSGTVTLQPVTGALGSVTASLPANTGTIGELNLAQTWSALQSFGANAAIGATAHGVLLSENASAAVATGAGTAGQFFRSGGSGADGGYADFPEHLIIPAANCNNATGGAGWSIPASNAPTVACRAGTNNLGGALQWANNNSTTNAQFTIQLPFDWDTATQPYINIVYGSGSNTSGTIKWTFSTACTKSDGSITDDPAFNAESATTGKTMAVANRMWAESVQFTAVTSGNNCIAGSTMIVKVTSGSGTATGTVNVAQATVTIPRLLTVQAN